MNYALKIMKIVLKVIMKHLEKAHSSQENKAKDLIFNEIGSALRIV